MMQDGSLFYNPPAMTYREHAPAPRLAAIVDRIWTLEGPFDSRDPGLAQGDQAVFPDGRPELILHFGDRFRRIETHGSSELQALSIVAGQLTGPLVLRPTGRVSVLGVRLRPYGAAALLRAPQTDFIGHTLDVELASPRLARALRSIRDDAASATEAVGLVQSRLVEHIAADRIDPAVRWAVDWIERRHGLVSIDRIASATGVTRRHLERRFLAKRLARIARFQRAVRTLESTEASDRGTQTAASCGYADQAHFIRDFQEFARCTPSRHLLERAELTGFFISRDPDVANLQAGSREAARR
jgi:AraC-like DNA-binding protein